jgi:hypothetical protein
MKKDYLLIYSLFLLFSSFFLFSSIVHANDIRLGGKLNASLTYFSDVDLGSVFLPQANLDLELFLPSRNNNELKLAGNLYTDISNSKVGFLWKKLYWERRFENLHLTIGRQPISWSFGCLLNPVDYSLGAVALNEEYSTKYQDAIEAYFPINWYTGLSLVASFPDNNSDLKVGLRGRTLINDFDVTVHFVEENILANEIVQRRLGITTKGDIGKFGVCSALGYYQEKEDSSLSFLAGIDYSYFFQTGSQLYLQVEYINLPPHLLSQVTSSMMSGGEEGKENIHLMAGNISYRIDEFSSIGLTSFCNFSDDNGLFMPAYSNQISTNTSIDVKGGIMLESKKGLDTLSLQSAFGQLSRTFVELGINYAF